MTQRGVIVNVARKQQINDFSGLRYGNITPTDVDGVIEYRNRGWIFLEIKYMDAQLPFGQRLALERMVRDTSMNGKRSIAVIAEHDIHDVGRSIPVADCPVREHYHYRVKKWIPPKQPINVRTLIDLFLDITSGHERRHR